MKIKLLLFLVLFAMLQINAQTNKELADKYLNKRGELVFTFTANNFEEAKELSLIISFDHGQDSNNPLVIKAIANKKNFKKFLTFNLPFTVDKKLNEPKNVVMFDPKIHKKGISGKNAAYTLTFPVVAYPTYADYAQQMADFAADHPAIAQLVDFGGTTEGAADGDKRLLFVKLSDNVSVREKEPRVMYTSSMHGDEITGFPMMLSLIDYFITAYEDTNHADHIRVKDLLDNSEVWINPLANPDGTYYNDATNTSVANAIRGNGNAIDLNRNYPDNIQGAHPDGEVYQVETLNFIAIAESTQFVLSANFHGGTEVVNYPWDNTNVRHPDDPWYFLISKEYAVNCQNDGPSGYMDATYTNYVWPGVTNGNDWYEVFGGRQDYMNYYQQDRELTIELSDVKTILASEIQNHWNYNREALIEYLIQGKYGFQGVVKDAVSGNPIKAKVTLVGHDAVGSWVETELFLGTELGDYYRPVKAGTYDILYEADCYQSVTLTNQVITDYQTIVLADVLLTPLNVVPTNLTVSSITSTTAITGWDLITSATYDLRYRVVGSPTWIDVLDIATTSYTIIGLTGSTNYEVQVRSKCAANTSTYTSSVNFTTDPPVPCTGTVVSSYPYSESFEIDLGGWIQGVNGTDDNIDWTRKDGEGDGNSTQSSNTGPADASIGGWFMYTEASNPNFPSKIANLDSPCFDLAGYKNGQFTFDYHMYGFAMGILKVQVSLDNGLNWTDLYTISGEQHSTYADAWTTYSIDLSAYNGLTIKLRLNGTTGSEYTSDMAIDNFSLTAEVDNALGIEDEILSEFVVYPNPVTNGEIKLKMPTEITDFTVLISNVFGQKVYQKEVTSNYNSLHKVPTANLQSGIYFITVSTNLGKATKKLIIQ